MNVAAATSELESLSQIDAKKVFEILSFKIQKVSDITNEPDGINGVRALVSIHGDLQNSLVGLIESFDCAKVGPWICKGWETSITTDDAKKRLKVYYGRLESDTSNLLVKAALKSTGK